MEDRDAQRQWADLKSGKPISSSISAVLKKQGIAYDDPEAEEQLAKRLRTLAKQQFTALRAHIILTYDCNLRCVYCYEEGIAREQKVITRPILQRMLEVIEQVALEGRYQTVQAVLFGGEPLLYRNSNVSRVQAVLEHAAQQGWEIEVVSNGVDLRYYVPLLQEYPVSQIQVTIDGPRHIHDIRRVTPDGHGSFDAIVSGVDAALSAGLPIVVRVNGDKQNVQHSPELVAFFKSQGWLDERRFGAYWGLTFDLHRKHPYCAPAHVILEEILEIRKRYPLTRRISVEPWEPVQFLLYPFLMGEPRLPKFEFCGAHRNDWCFDLYGDVYFCADGVGREEFKVGTYYPELALDVERVSLWRQCDIDRVPGCNRCRVRLCCGGGCWFRRTCQTGSPLTLYCTEQVFPLLQVTLRYLHRSPEVFELEIAKEAG